MIWQDHNFNSGPYTATNDKIQRVGLYERKSLKGWKVMREGGDSRFVITNIHTFKKILSVAHICMLEWFMLYPFRTKALTLRRNFRNRRCGVKSVLSSVKIEMVGSLKTLDHMMMVLTKMIGMTFGPKNVSIVYFRIVAHVYSSLQ